MNYDEGRGARVPCWHTRVMQFAREV